MATGNQRVGRPRDSRIDHAVLQAVRRLLIDVGYDGFTIDDVAAHAAVSRAAIYRRFDSKAELVFAASVHGLDATPPADTGTLGGDLLAMARFIRDNMGRTEARQAAPALVAALARDPELVTRFRQTFVAKEQADFAVLVDRALARGELTRPIDPSVLHLLLSGPIFAALFAFHTPVDEHLLNELITVIVDGLGAAT
ncbi:MAG TPA: TetR/AcrR family transcriptional regulator [Pilimelia sp.]|nr:TetR/AcrR family transcriptional regulator [Pilimelia sp.]